MTEFTFENVIKNTALQLCLNGIKKQTYNFLGYLLLTSDIDENHVTSEQKIKEILGSRINMVLIGTGKWRLTQNLEVSLELQPLRKEPGYGKT